jgi:SAM-dependent methyltransferase
MPEPSDESTPPRAGLPPAVRAFDRTAPRFDERFGAWRSVAAQRRAVRRELVRTFPPGGRVLDLGAGTGEDALFLLERGYDVTITDGSPTMVERARDKLRQAGFADRPPPEQVVLEDLDRFADTVQRQGRPPYDGAYSNFAAFNCVADLPALAGPLASLLRPGAHCLLVVFGPCSVGEVVVELLRGRPRAAVRRFRRGAAPARLGGEHFAVWYPSPRTVARALAPYFRLRRTRGIGILVPPSAAEPFVSRFPRIVGALEAADRVLTAPLALLADHVLLDLERTAEPAPAPLRPATPSPPPSEAPDIPDTP